jgi:RNA polymerase sigma-70 factor (ECF subfamily)
MADVVVHGAETHDPARLGEIIAQHRPAVEAAARRLCRTAAEAADLVQDTYERALRHAQSLRSEACARAWLIRILRNCFLDHCRRGHREAPVADPPEPAPSFEPSRWERITTNDLHRAIAELGEPFRSVAILHDVDGLSHAEVSARLDIPYTTVATRLHRAHQRLKEILWLRLEQDEDGR